MCMGEPSLTVGLVPRIVDPPVATTSKAPPLRYAGALHAKSFLRHNGCSQIGLNLIEFFQAELSGPSTA